MEAGPAGSPGLGRDDAASAARRRAVRAVASACPVRVRTGLVGADAWLPYDKDEGSARAKLRVDVSSAGFRDPMPNEFGSLPLHDGYHGDPSREHSFWVYSADKALVTPRWDTHDNPQVACKGAVKVGPWHRNDSMIQYRCPGHAADGGMWRTAGQTSELGNPVFVCELEARAQHGVQGAGAVYRIADRPMSREFGVYLMLDSVNHKGAPGTIFRNTMEASKPTLRWLGFQRCDVADLCLSGSAADALADRLPVQLRAGIASDWTCVSSDNTSACCTLSAATSDERSDTAGSGGMISSSSGAAAAGAGSEGEATTLFNFGGGVDRARCGECKAPGLGPPSESVGYTTRMVAAEALAQVRGAGLLHPPTVDSEDDVDGRPAEDSDSTHRTRVPCYTVRPVVPDGPFAEGKALSMTALAKMRASVHWIGVASEADDGAAAAARLLGGLDDSVPAVPSTGLVAHWPLTPHEVHEDGVDGVALDAVGEHPATLHRSVDAPLVHINVGEGQESPPAAAAAAAAAAADTPSGDALAGRAAAACARSSIVRFSGCGSAAARSPTHFTGPPLSLFNGDPAFSVCGWVWLDNVVGTAPLQLETSGKFCVFRQGPRVKEQIALYIVDGLMTVHIRGLGVVASTRVVSARRWHHLAVTKAPGDIVANARLYIDGEQVRHTRVGDAPTDGTPPMTLGLEGMAFQIGGVSVADSAPGGRTSTEHPWRGHIEDVSVSNCALTPAQVATLAGAAIRDAVRARIGGRDIDCWLSSHDGGAWELDATATSQLTTTVSTRSLGFAAHAEGRVAYATSLYGNNAGWEASGETALQLTHAGFSVNIVHHGGVGYATTYKYAMACVAIELGYARSLVEEEALRRSLLRVWQSLAEKGGPRGPVALAPEDSADAQWRQVRLVAAPAAVGPRADPSGTLAKGGTSEVAGASGRLGDGRRGPPRMSRMAQFAVTVGGRPASDKSGLQQSILLVTVSVRMCAGTSRADEDGSHGSAETRDADALHQRVDARVLFYAPGDAAAERRAGTTGTVPPMSHWTFAARELDGGACEVEMSLRVLDRAAELRPQLWKLGPGSVVPMGVAAAAAGANDSMARLWQAQHVVASRFGVFECTYSVS